MFIFLFWAINVFFTKAINVYICNLRDGNEMEKYGEVWFL